MIEWNKDYKGIVVDARVADQFDFQLSDIRKSQRTAFISATSACLYRLESRPVGRDLLRQISNRCQGIGSRGARLTCRITVGQGTVTKSKSVAAAAVEATGQMPDFGGDTLTALVDAMPLNYRGAMTLTGRTNVAPPRQVSVAGTAMSALVAYNPFIDYDTVTFVKIGVPLPPFIALGHELVHALHRLSGDRISHPYEVKETLIEEARTVGAGKYAAKRISENALRKEHGLPRRAYYEVPGDCDNQ